ncbi:MULTISPECIES: TetR family transcriptional regulator [Pseudonocardia]|uniref:HTH-type transcriptional repressor NicS n=2 Tax=Pseudonocardia TaxID=1847 RepID=A0A1Y2MH95_PSEAH|nr:MULTISPECIES: TetR family transcriptional regulator [Pseudonocardia]OSY34471.1 HTH-type transcriptional repressor NicS [Pseudonocardia autotrophica]TDN72644.1 TetR family transcriptional regulator [Pseudonocardia autotrophica]BBG03356.1 TetR family transcriptional regulator [Pseudonocardia autotrophica]GEC29719.1 TetR family transcriptional regulator [Pseudonocardia saturnea]
MSDEPTTARGAASYRRLLDAATSEFAAAGIAGARIDRVITAADSNKTQLYSYFGSKDGLFDAVFARAQREFTEGVRIEDDDLADWAVRLYDEYLRRPDLVRLVTWARLERRPRGSMADPEPDGQRVDDAKTERIRAAQKAGRVREGDPADIMAMVIAMSMAWSPVSNVYAAHPDEPDSVHEQRRTMLREWVRTAVAPR